MRPTARWRARATAESQRAPQPFVALRHFSGVPVALRRAFRYTSKYLLNDMILSIHANLACDGRQTGDA